MRVIDANTVELQYDFDEPTINADLTPLSDLAYSSIYITDPTGVNKVHVQVQASSPNGGGHRTGIFLVSAPLNQLRTYRFDASSTDTAGNESDKVGNVMVNIDRITPALPRNFGVV